METCSSAYLHILALPHGICSYSLWEMLHYQALLVLPCSASPQLCLRLQSKYRCSKLWWVLPGNSAGKPAWPLYEADAHVHMLSGFQHEPLTRMSHAYID